MASIALLVDITEGHIYPSFGLAQSLLDEGHTVTYLNIPDNEEVIKAHGFGFYPILGQACLKGKSASGQTCAGNTARVSNLMLRIGLDQLDIFFATIKPDLFIINGFLCIECLLLYYRYGIRPVILSTYLRNPKISLSDLCIEMIMKLSGDEAAQTIDFAGKTAGAFRSLREFTHPLTLFPELILCPKELEKESLPASGTIHYVEPSIRLEASGNGALPEYIPNGKQVVYASLGSHSSAYGDVCSVFFRKLIDAMRSERLSGIHLILSVGKEFDRESLGFLPPNVTALPWVQQLPVIKASTVVITHGGLGTIKECIYFGVPMIVIPIAHDQPRNGSLVEFHGLGISRQIDQLTEEMIVSGIYQLANDQLIASNLKKMQQIFQDSEKDRPGRRIVEGLLTKYDDQE